MTEISRRKLITTLGAAAGAAIVMPGGARAQGKPQSAPTVISNPPRDFGPDAPPTTYFAIPMSLTIDPAFDGLVQPNTSIKRLWTGALWAEGPAWSSAGAVPGVERHSEQPSAALARRRRARDGVPEPVEQQQRQHVRFAGPAAVVRAPDAPRRAIRARRIDHGHRRAFRASVSTRRTTSCAHPDGSYWFTDPPYGGQLYEGAAGCERRAEQSAGSIEAARRAAGGHRHVQARAADERVSRRSERAGSISSSRKIRCRIRTASRSRLISRSSTSRAPARDRATPAPAARANLCVRRRRRQRCRTKACSRTASIDGVKCGPDGVRCDVDGNVWCVEQRRPRASATAA